MIVPWGAVGPTTAVGVGVYKPPHVPPNERGMYGKAPTRYSTSTSSIMTMWFLFPALLCLPCLATFCACEVCSFP
eukprot:scaffold199_cov138-Isochrysis_galbana.AAC.2